VDLLWALENFDLRALIDILIVAALFYGVSLLFRGTQAVALLRGTVALLVGMVALSQIFAFQALGWVLNNLLTVLAVAIPIIFQPELRRALEQLGRANFFGGAQVTLSQRAELIDEIVQAAEKLSERRHGALIVLERDSTLSDFIRTGIALDSDVSAQLLLTIFWPKTELHDGAVIIDRAGRLAAAAAVLPLTASRNMPNRKMGTRHRAALGISEVSDAVCILVSEETGKIVVTQGGRMIPRIEEGRLRPLLEGFFTAPPNPYVNPLGFARQRLRQWSARLQRRKTPHGGREGAP
jgi:diadenylate cyclase